MAHVVCSPRNAVRVALVTADDPATALIFDVSGTPSVQHLSTTSPAATAKHKMSCRQIGSVSVPDHSAAAAGAAKRSPLARRTAIAKLALMPGGASLAVLAASTQKAEPSLRLHLFREQHGQAGPHPGSCSWSPSPSASYSPPAAAAGSEPLRLPPSMAVAPDGSKVLLVHAGIIRVLDPGTLQLVATVEAAVPPSAAGVKAPTSRAPGHAASLSTAVASCFSPNACCALAAEPSCTGGSSMATLVRVVTVPDSLPPAMAGGADSAWKMEAFRLAWATLNGTHPWDAAQRCSGGGAGDSSAEKKKRQQHVAAALGALDGLWHSFDRHSMSS